MIQWVCVFSAAAGAIPSSPASLAIAGVKRAYGWRFVPQIAGRTLVGATETSVTAGLGVVKAARKAACAPPAVGESRHGLHPKPAELHGRGERAEAQPLEPMVVDL